MSWLKNHLPQKRRYRIALYLFSCLLILLAADMLLVQAWRHIDISPETTRITSPLNADGLPDYIAFHNAQASQGITPDNNAAPAILQILGTDEYSDTWRNTVLPQLGLSPAGHPPQFLTYDAWLLAHHTEEPTKDDAVAMLKTPWTSTENPLRAQWLKNQAPILNNLHDALKKNRFYIPWATNTGNSLSGQAIDAPLHWISRSRDCSRTLTADTMRAIGEKDSAAFNRDIADQFQLVHIYSQGSTMIEYLVGCASQETACKDLQLAAAAPGFLTTDQIQMFHELLRSDTLADESYVIDGDERFLLLDGLCFASRHGLDELQRRLNAGNPNVPPSHPVASLFLPIHFNKALRVANIYFDQLAAAAKLPTHTQRINAFKKAQTDLPNSFDPAVAFIAPVAPLLNTTVVRQTIASTQRSLTQLALALNAYHTAHNQYPTSLNDLTPAFLPSFPQDEFADAPFHYQPTEKGYTLYSVGPDGQDDHGAERTLTNNIHYDIVVKTNQ